MSDFNISIGKSRSILAINYRNVSYDEVGGAGNGWGCEGTAYRY
jgi:hypothetical protein